MLKKLQSLFDSPKSDTSPSASDVKLAAATLMFEMIRSDGQIDEVELNQMRSLLESQMDIAEEDIEELVNQAQSNAEDAISLQGFTRQICERWDNDQRLQLIENLWLLALADQTIDANERHLVRKIAGLLYMTDRQINIAKESAKLKLEQN